MLLADGLRSPLRAAIRAASLTRFLPGPLRTKPGVRFGQLQGSPRPRPAGLPRRCTFRMDLLALLHVEGRPTTTWRSKRPGRRRAGSRMSGRLVAARTMTVGVLLKAVHLHQDLVQGLLPLVVAAAQSPPPAFCPMESSSSMKMMQGEWRLAGVLKEVSAPGWRRRPRTSP
jgi:hypothetical protein